MTIKNLSTKQKLEILIDKIGESEIIRYYHENLIGSPQLWTLIENYYIMINEPKSDEYFGINGDNYTILEQFEIDASKENNDKSLLNAYTLNKSDFSVLERYIDELAEMYDIEHNQINIENLIDEKQLNNPFTHKSVANTLKSSKIDNKNKKTLLKTINEQNETNEIDVEYNYKLLFNSIDDDIKIICNKNDNEINYLQSLLKTLEMYANENIMKQYKFIKNSNDENLPELTFLANQTRNLLNELN